MALDAKESADGVRYEYLRTPVRVALPTVQYAAEPLTDKFTVHHVYVRCKDVKAAGMPLDANPREPSQTTQVREMQETLQKSPRDFFKLNNGLTVLCERVSFDQEHKKCMMDFANLEGICNGGHTYFAIVTVTAQLSDEAIVHLEVIEFPSGMEPTKKSQEIVKISRARNNNNRLSLRSEANYLGYYDLFKKRLAHPEFVIWREGDSSAVDGAIKAEDYIRMLTALDPKKYYHPVFHPRGERHKTPVTAVASIHNAWFEEMEQYRSTGASGTPPLGHVAVLGNDLFKIRDQISETLMNR